MMATSDYSKANAYYPVSFRVLFLYDDGACYLYYDAACYLYYDAACYLYYDGHEYDYYLLPSCLSRVYFFARSRRQASVVR